MFASPPSAPRVKSKPRPWSEPRRRVVAGLRDPKPRRRDDEHLGRSHGLDSAGSVLAGVKLTVSDGFDNAAKARASITLR